MYRPSINVETIMWDYGNQLQITPIELLRYDEGDSEYLKYTIQLPFVQDNKPVWSEHFTGKNWAADMLFLSPVFGISLHAQNVTYFFMLMYTYDQRAELKRFKRTEFLQIMIHTTIS